MFITQIRADSSDRSPWGSFWFSELGSKTSATMPVNADTAMTLAAVYRAVFLISGHIAGMSLVLKKSGTNQRITDHWMHRLWKRPNSQQTGFLWRRFLLACLLLRGNAYCEIITDRRGNILELLPLHPDAVTPERLTTGDYRYKVQRHNGTTENLTRERIWHLRGLTLDGLTGISVIAAARESLATGLAAQAYGNRYFANDARPHSGWISFNGKFATDQAKKDFQAGLARAQTGANRGKTLVLEHGMEYHDVSVSNADAQFLESRKFGVDEVARWFGVPPHKLASLDRATFSNIEQQSMEYINDGLLIWATSIESAIEGDLLFESDALDPVLDFGVLLRGDSKTRYENHNLGIMAGWLTRNEARGAEGLEPIDGLDEPLRPLNMVEESDAEDQEEDVEAAEPPEQEATEPLEPEEPAGKDARLRALIAENAGRLARRIEKEGTARADLIAAALAVPLAAAEAWTQRLRILPADALAAELIALALDS